MIALLTLLRPYLRPILEVVAAVAVCAAIVAYLHHRGVVDAERAQKDREIAEYQAQVVKAHDVAEKLEQQLDAATTRANQLNERLKDELANNPVYHECRVPADGVRLLQDARAANSPGTR